MKKANFARLSAASLAVFGILLSPGFGDGATAAPLASQGAAVADPRLEMVRTLEALGPSPALGEQANVFGRFVGTWDVDYGEIGEDGKVTRFPGELIAGWVMDGHALQDLFIAYPSAAGKERTMGTTLRFLDSKSGKWHVVYIEPPSNTVFELTGGQEGDRIVLYGKHKDGSVARWSFNEIKNDSFTWRDEISHDSGKTWRLTEEHYMKRRLTAVSPNP
ncbi:MAG TPA: hypothetical protein VGT99_07585 [Gammaproteobacteria bacterium]|nr:hypothetical protein [Gammaproteobacteria bacterium]